MEEDDMKNKKDKQKKGLALIRKKRKKLQLNKQILQTILSWRNKQN